MFGMRFGLVVYGILVFDFVVFGAPSVEWFEGLVAVVLFGMDATLFGF